MGSVLKTLSWWGPPVWGVYIQHTFILTNAKWPIKLSSSILLSIRINLRLFTFRDHESPLSLFLYLFYWMFFSLFHYSISLFSLNYDTTLPVGIASLYSGNGDKCFHIPELNKGSNSQPPAWQLSIITSIIYQIQLHLNPKEQTDACINR